MTVILWIVSPCCSAVWVALLVLEIITLSSVVTNVTRIVVQKIIAKILQAMIPNESHNEMVTLSLH